MMSGRSIVIRDVPHARDATEELFSQARHQRTIGSTMWRKTLLVRFLEQPKNERLRETAARPNQVNIRRNQQLKSRPG